MRYIKIQFSKYSNFVVILITLALFIIPFFWFKPGFVDFGGDGANLYFIDPLIAINNTISPQVSSGFFYAMIPYLFFQYLLKCIISSPTYMAAFEHGLQLSISYFATYLLVKEIIVNAGKRHNYFTVSLVGIISGICYVGLMTKMRWFSSLETLNQTFLNPIMFYLLLRSCITGNIVYVFISIVISLLYSANFGLMSIPQLASFYPFALLFLYIYIRFILKKSINWSRVFGVTGLFLGIHFFHLLPVIASVFEKQSAINSYIFSGKSINAGVYYFDVNHAGMGRIADQLFQTNQWNGQTILALLIPILLVLGFVKKRTKLLVTAGGCFIVTLFLTVANITHTGVKFYRMLFLIPGFMMFRSYDEKWFCVFAIFYTVTFAISLYYLLKQKKYWFQIVICLLVVSSVLYRIYPFFQGAGIQKTHYLSNNVSTIYKIDQNLTDTLKFIKTLPQDGKVASFPLTFPNYQVAYGEKGGAYVGVPFVFNLTGKQTIAGLWQVEPFRSAFLTAMRDGKVEDVMQILSLLNIRYIFYNSDSRILDNFPSYPNIRYDYPDTDKSMFMKDQEAYQKLLALLPTKSIYSKGFYSIYEIENKYIRPYIYIPDFVSIDEKKLSTSYRSTLSNEAVCKRISCDELSENIPAITVKKHSSVFYEIEIDTKGIKIPFSVVLSDTYNPEWKLVVGVLPKVQKVQNISSNGYTNMWLIDPSTANTNGIIHGYIYLSRHLYFIIGCFISSISLCIAGLFLFRALRKKKYEKT